MTEGHPGFVANNGRLGFGIADCHVFAPEAGAAVQLDWMAVHRNQAVFTSAEGLGYRDHLDAELGTSAVAHFDAEPVRPRTGVHAARGKRHPDPGGRRPGQRHHERHRRGNRGDG
ncbi:IucA/IucC family protein [Arthrobacter sp. NPDC058130]|uniref:IucA/IucC family protein n=1 Tax=Arthrobacter sp. NPDC058130 TaxID=3346353 RepID=UPI0036EABD27